MDGVNEKRFALKFCCKAGLSATQTLVLVQKADGSENLNRYNGLSWYSQFWDGRELVEDDEWGGCPKLCRTEVNIAAVADLVKNYLQITSKIAEYLNIPKTVVLWILKQDLGKRKLCAHFVPHSFTPEQREDRVTFAKTLSRWPRQTIFLTNLLWEMRPGILPLTPKQNDRFLNGLVRHPLRRRSWYSKGPKSRPCW